MYKHLDRLYAYDKISANKRKLGDITFINKMLPRQCFHQTRLMKLVPESKKHNHYKIKLCSKPNANDNKRKQLSNDTKQSKINAYG